MLESLKVSTKRDAPLDADTSGVGSAEQIQQPAFITSASLTTFGGGSFAITVIWRLVDGITGVDSRWVPGVVAIALGVFFLVQSLEGGKLTSSQKMAAVFVALVNAGVLWAAAVGIDVGIYESDIAESATAGD